MLVPPSRIKKRSQSNRCKQDSEGQNHPWVWMNNLRIHAARLRTRAKPRQTQTTYERADFASAERHSSKRRPDGGEARESALARGGRDRVSRRSGRRQTSMRSRLHGSEPDAQRKLLLTMMKPSVTGGPSSQFQHQIATVLANALLPERLPPRRCSRFFQEHRKHQ